MEPGSLIKVTGLLWANIVADFVTRIMVTYLINVWKLNFTHAAGMMNVYEGIATIMPIGMYFLVKTYFGNFGMLLLSSFAYCIGMSFLTLSTPPVTGKCSAYEPECIGNVQSILFYMSLALIAIGKSGHLVSREPFLIDQKEDEQDYALQCGDYKFGDCCAVIYVPITGTIALAFLESWSERFGIAAMITVIVTIWFLCGSSSYVIHEPGSDDTVEPLMSGRRCLDKAGIISPSHALEEQDCRITKTKITLLMTPLWMTFITVGLVLSIGNTYFLEQANNLNPKVGLLKIPLPILLVYYDMAKTLANKLYMRMANNFTERKRKYAPPVGIALGISFSIICCIVAAKVEDRRIDVIKKHGLVDKPNDRIPMSMFWLLPQFLLLGLVDGFSHLSVERLIHDQVPKLMRSYMTNFSEGAFGVGIISGVLSIYIVGKVSERGGQSSWFGDNLNQSRLDNYYWILALLSSINLVFFAMVAICYPYRELDVNEEEEETPNYDYIESCCCWCC